MEMEIITAKRLARVITAKIQALEMVTYSFGGRCKASRPELLAYTSGRIEAAPTKTNHQVSPKKEYGPEKSESLKPPTPEPETQKAEASTLSPSTP